MSKKMKKVKDKVLVPHDGITEWSVCGACGTHIDWANEVMCGAREREEDDMSCPHCGSDDTVWLERDE